MLTKTQIKIMEIFVSKITEKFSIQQISKIINKPYPLVHRSIKKLIEEKYLIKDKHKLLSLNYKQNSAELSYTENLRKKNFLKKNKTFALFEKDILENMPFDFFSLIIFGSFIQKSSKPRDIDILLIIEDENKLNNAEKVLRNLSSNFSLKFDINIVTNKSAKEMILKRDEPNIFNETLNNHLILFGAENYYKLLKNVR